MPSRQVLITVCTLQKQQSSLTTALATRTAAAFPRAFRSPWLFVACTPRYAFPLYNNKKLHAFLVIYLLATLHLM